MADTGPRRVVVLVALLLFLAPSHAAAIQLESHSGVVVAIDAETGVLIIDEVGPWHAEPGLAMLTRRTIRLTPATEYGLVIRSALLGDDDGAYIELVLRRGDVLRDDFVTVECVWEGGRLTALAVIVSELR
jgi:hypothetical protein